MEEKSSLSLSIKSRGNVLNGDREVASVFNQDSESEEEAPASAEEKFRQKYGNKKEKDERAVKKVLEEDKTVYDYDGHYDEMERRREEIKSSKKQSDKDGGPKYADKLLKAKQRRDLEKLIIEERKQDRERAAEGDEFEDKEAFVTEAYKKQIEEKEKFRKELEAEEKINEINDVTKSSMYRETFAKKLLDDAAAERELIIKGPSVPEVKQEEELSKENETKTTSKAGGKKKFVPFTDSEESDGPVTPPPETLKAGLNVKKPKEETEDSRKERTREKERHRSRERNRSRDRDRDTRPRSRDRDRRDRRDDRGRRDSKYSRDDKYRRDHRVDKHRDSRRRSPERRSKKVSISPVRRSTRQSKSPPRKRSKSPRRRSPSPRRRSEKRRSPERKRSESRTDRKKDKDVKPRTKKASSDSDEELLKKEANGTLTSRERQFLEQKRRMKKVKKVLAHRNNQDQIDAYMKRYFKRREEGLIEPPIVGQDEKIKY
ncbi:unnamed protein product [Bursaphelenchus xylophilus]|uniref:(pine wood nematode) hypothetical protein n=1 Tax=Bursaphelenchus xylophilus TaxID=6326 RepID=A0A1I7SBI3_BURXY|nr:unnamed protein product [Bursaphelenchus xylophilus]CAG9121974.1 unnamed protein product [Bursaphelenchus xylophilus]